MRVAFVMAHRDQGWMGGLNYLSNLIRAILAVPESGIEPVLIASPDAPMELLARIPSIETVRTNLVDDRRPVHVLRKGLGRLVARDPLMERLLIGARIALLSHSGWLGTASRVPSLAWIPDFQHLRLPDLYSPAALRHLDGTFARICERSTGVVVSSCDVREDLLRFQPHIAPRCRVLHFVSGLAAAGDSGDDPASVARRLGVDEPYFHLPNQFWVHKNHAVVVDALAALRSSGRHARVVCTGHTADPRRPDHFDALRARIDRLGVSAQFTMVGVVPYADVVALMRGAIAVINPSRFEGWSTTVEECKSIGKQLLLSDIPVHREQAPPRARYFDPDDPQRLADLIEETQRHWTEAEEQRAQHSAAAELPDRFAAFGRDYARIARWAVGHRDGDRLGDAPATTGHSDWHTGGVPRPRDERVRPERPGAVACDGVFFDSRVGTASGDH